MCLVVRRTNSRTCRKCLSLNLPTSTELFCANPFNAPSIKLSRTAVTASASVCLSPPTLGEWTDAVRLDLVLLVHRGLCNCDPTSPYAVFLYAALCCCRPVVLVFLRFSVMCFVQLKCVLLQLSTLYLHLSTPRYHLLPLFLKQTSIRVHTTRVVQTYMHTSAHILLLLLLSFPLSPLYSHSRSLYLLSFFSLSLFSLLSSNLSPLANPPLASPLFFFLGIFSVSCVFFASSCAFLLVCLGCVLCGLLLRALVPLWLAS